VEAAGGKSQRKFGGVTRCGTQSREATSPTSSGNGRQVPDGVNGREAASRQIFLHVEGPDGLIFSYVNGMAELDDKPRLARQFPGSKPDFDESFRNYREQMVHALLMWTITLCHSPLLPDMQPEQTTLTMIERITTAMADLDSLDSFRDV